MPKTRTTVVAEKEGQLHKIFKVWFGRDGSYYVTVPYHSAKIALLFKRTVSYETPFGQTQYSTSDSFVDVAVLDDDEGRLKLAHHPDGFCQFSGQGVLSGKAEDGSARGVAVFARALRAIGPKFGPVFIVRVHGIEEFEVGSQSEADDIVFRIDDLAPPTPESLPREAEIEETNFRFPERDGLWVEGFYFTPAYRRFIGRDFNGHLAIYMPHPTGIVIPLRVVLAPADCDLPGFLGLYACRVLPRFESASGFSIAGPAENYRQDSLGNRIGDVISCEFPRITLVDGRSVQYRGREPPNDEISTGGGRSCGIQEEGGNDGNTRDGNLLPERLPE
jgi:hypothetical protein